MCLAIVYEGYAQHRYRAKACRLALPISMPRPVTLEELGKYTVNPVSRLVGRSSGFVEKDLSITRYICEHGNEHGNEHYTVFSITRLI